MSTDEDERHSDWLEAQGRWIEPCLGRVLDRNGRGGSGVFIRHPDGPIVLLTAAHVAFGAALSGEVTVLAAGLVPTRSVESPTIFLDDRADLAIMVWPQGGPEPECLGVSSWKGRDVAEQIGVPVVSCGFPGQLQDTPDLDTRTINTGRYLHFWSEAVEEATDGCVGIDATEAHPSLPGTFRGMSGGPVFDQHGILLGVNTAEWSQPGGSRQIRYTPVQRRSHLIEPYRPPPKSDWRIEDWRRKYEVEVSLPDGMVYVKLEMSGELFSDDDAKRQIIRTSLLKVTAEHGSYDLRVESVVEDYAEDDEEIRAAIADECAQILWDVVGAEVVTE